MGQLYRFGLLAHLASILNQEFILKLKKYLFLAQYKQLNL